jgi:predicted P-loop ATPase
VDLQRLAVLGGTSNENEILTDPTGNRRIIPINVLSINHEAYNAIDKIDVLMEAYHLFKSGFKWELSRDDIRTLNNNTGYFEQSSPEYDLLTKTFERPADDNKPWTTFMTATEIKSTSSSAPAKD